ncbi:hypothetical protein [Kitasatospora sp. NPDC059571]|uniref:hypothetical protein n=1 Tax=Kitasatospora sp. NPDC059571 TaxID=3346871 RepID=UPI0036847052
MATMTACGSGEVLRDGECVLAGGTAIVSYLMLLLIGLGAIAVGVYLWRQRKSAAPVVAGGGPDKHGRQAAEKIIHKVAPYFLMFWGCGAVVGFMALMAKR